LNEPRLSHTGLKARPSSTRPFLFIGALPGLRVSS
jgi:hypothetical protein